MRINSDLEKRLDADADDMEAEERRKEELRKQGFPSYEQFDKRIKTSELNNFLTAAIDAYSVPQKNNNPVRLNYMTQTRVRPPTFVIWANSPDGVPVSYKRYLENRLRDTYGFDGTPLRIQVRQKRRPGEEKPR